MNTSFLKRLAAWTFPEGAVLAAAAIVVHLHSLHEPVRRLTGTFAGAVLVAGAAVGLRFARSRVVFALLLLGLAQRFLPHVGRGDAAAERAALQAIAILLPLNLAAFGLLPERGLLTLSGFGRLATILGQAVGVAAFTSATPAQTAAALERALLPAGLTAWTPLGDLALAAYFVAAGVLLVGQFFEFGANGRPTLWVVIATFLALNADPVGPAATFYLATAGLVLVVGVVETSFSLAYRDGLTGLPARRAFNEALERLGGACVVAMVDVDHFKQVNDQHGHEVGDQVLKMVAAHLARVGAAGRPFRYGGEEFAILFPGKTVAEVVPEAERLRAEVAQSTFAVRSRTRRRRKPRAPRTTRSRREVLAVTISIGIAKDVAAADRALYQAKEGGRNRVAS